MQTDTYISVDIETAGPYPGRYAILSIGACLVDDPAESFYVELQPDRPDFTPEALQISGLSLDRLMETGVPAQEAMRRFSGWLADITPQGSRSVCVALNAPFDWMFISDYFYRYLGFNPFGHSALDIKAYYMGAARVNWSETSFNQIAAHFDSETALTHNALRDAQDQARLFHRLLVQGGKYDRSGSQSKS